MVIELREEGQEMPVNSSTPKPAPFKRLVVFTSVASLDASS
jgi:hypothetical protein